MRVDPPDESDDTDSRRSRGREQRCGEQHEETPTPDGDTYPSAENRLGVNLSPP
jgi:hypothetical protein